MDSIPPGMYLDQLLHGAVTDAAPEHHRCEGCKQLRLGVFVRNVVDGKEWEGFRGEAKVLVMLL